MAEEQVDSLHMTIKKRLQQVSRQTTVEILATFKQETEFKKYYLSAVLVRSKLAHDTKLTMKPFLNYQVTGEKLAIRINKVEYSIQLTNRVRFGMTRTGPIDGMMRQ